MPKVKTKKAIAKRIKITKTGKIIRRHQRGKGHLRAGKPKKKTHQYKRILEVSKTEGKKIRKLLPYAK
jgi:large subunit ribosomal protein L35